MSLARYGEYKESGVEWLGRVPSHWQLARLKDVAHVINGYPFDSKLFESNGIYPLIRIRDLDASETATRYSGDFVPSAVVSSEDVLIGMDGDFNVGQWLGSEQALLNQRMCCVRTKSRSLNTFLRHALPIPLKAINDITYSTTVKHLSSLDVEKIRFALPGDGELAAIASFLDRETTKIDALIAEQEKLIALLAEKRQATISHSVTKGLNPSVQMKDSGVAWLGEVPEHWDVMQLRHFASVLRGKFTHRPRNDPAFYDGEYPFIQTGDITSASRYIEAYRQTLNDRGAFVSKEFPAGTLVMAIAANIGDVAILNFPAYFPDSIVGMVPKSEVDINYLYYLLIAMKPSMLRTATISTQMNLNIEQITSLIAASPPKLEQERIAKWLDDELEKLETLKITANKGISLLQERRSALITAAVTGQIDVRNLAPEIPA